MNGSGMKLDGKKKKEWLLGLKISFFLGTSTGPDMRTRAKRVDGAKANGNDALLVDKRGVLIRIARSVRSNCRIATQRRPLRFPG